MCESAANARCAKIIARQKRQSRGPRPAACARGSAECSHAHAEMLYSADTPSHRAGGARIESM